MNSVIKPSKPVYILSSASVAGMEEKDGPLGDQFDIIDSEDDTFGKDTWEKAESEMQRLAIHKALALGLMKDSELDAVLAGDLLNQCAGSHYGQVSMDVPFLGLYGACSTAAEAVLMSTVLCSTYYTRCAAVTSSHNASAERQFRFPLEYGSQRTPTSQWTVTGAGAFILTSDANDLKRPAHPGGYTVEISRICPGKMVDAGVTDPNNMGAAMAPAAADTLTVFFENTKTLPGDYDMILTGDLGAEGSAILRDIMKSRGTDIESIYNDCGMLIYDREAQDKHSGGSGCGCSAAVLSAYCLPLMRAGKLKRVLFLGTGALLNTMSILQGMSIPGIAHLVQLSAFPTARNAYGEVRV